MLIAKRRLLQAAALTLDERSPLKILERGYAIAYDASGKVLRSPDQVDARRRYFGAVGAW